MPTQPKMYVLVRLDLSRVYSLVQGGHALSQYALEHEPLFKAWDNGTLIYLGVPHLRGLRYWKEKLEKEDKNFSVFQEPDLDNQETAIACFDLGNIFKSLGIVK